jgi:hypothetical protein
MKLEFISLLEKSPVRYSGKNPDDQPPFSKRLPEQVVAWEDRSELFAPTPNPKRKRTLPPTPA